MTNEVIVRDHSIRDLIPFDPMPYDAAVRKALAERARAKRAADDCLWFELAGERTTSARQDSPLPGHFPAARAEPATVRARRRRLSPPPASAARACWGSCYPPNPVPPSSTS